MAALNVEFNKEATPWLIEFSGFCDESSEIPQFSIKTEAVKVDLGKLKGINSSGIKQWIRWVRTWPVETRFIVAHCPAFMADHFGAVQDMLPPRADLESFYVPYAHPTTEESEYVLYRQGVHFSKSELNIPIRVSSQNSGHPLELDVTPQRFFHFLKKFYPGIRI